MSPHTPAALGQRKASPSLPRRALLALAATLACGVALPLQAQPNASGWPAKPVKLVVGYAAGGATDVIARLVAVKLGDQLGQPVVVDNRAGANSNVGAEAVARAPADGYTLYVFTIANTINATLYPKLGYDPVKDFEPIGMIAKIPNILVVNPKLPIKNLADYVRYAKEAKDGITFASSGSGSRARRHRPAGRPGGFDVRQHAVGPAPCAGGQAARHCHHQRPALAPAARCADAGRVGVRRL